MWPVHICVWTLHLEIYNSAPRPTLSIVGCREICTKSIDIVINNQIKGSDISWLSSSLSLYPMFYFYINVSILSELRARASYPRSFCSFFLIFDNFTSSLPEIFEEISLNPSTQWAAVSILFLVRMEPPQKTWSEPWIVWLCFFTSVLSATLRKSL